MQAEERELRFIDQLRDEAATVKSCFTTFSFQAIAFSSAVLSVLFATMHKMPIVVLSAVPVIVFLMIICRIGIYKYATANRLFGYQLHLERTRPGNWNYKKDGWEEKHREIRWEEAQRAWRVVQTCIFRKIYITTETDAISLTLKKWKFNWINYFRTSLYNKSKEVHDVINEFSEEKDKAECSRYPWFLLEQLTAKERSGKEDIKELSYYHAGTYLKNILGILILMQYLLLLPLGMLFLQSIEKFQVFQIAKTSQVILPPSWFSLSVLLLMLLLIKCRSIRIHRRREILEKELLSIHSCSIIWQAVVLAHFRALKNTNNSYRHYTQRLLEQALDLRDNVFNIHEWIDPPGAVMPNGVGPSQCGGRDFWLESLIKILFVLKSLRK